MIMKNLKALFGFAMLFCFFSIKVNAQVSIIFLDSINKTPISHLSFFYGNKRGISDASGKINFIFKEDITMQISHINYGDRILTVERLKQAVKTGNIELKSRDIDLFPVNIIALRPNINETRIVNLNYQDKMMHDAGALLNQSISINSIRKGGNYGLDPVLRGFKYDQLNIVFNGVQSATAACPNRMDPPTSQITPNMIDRVEIIKGPYALRFGNGFGGTINYIQKKANLGESNKTYGRVSAAYESNAEVMRNETMLGFTKKKIKINLYGAYASGNDYKTGDKTIIQSNFERYNLGSDLAFIINSKQAIELSANRNFARDVDFPALPMDLRNDDTWMLNASHTIRPKQRKLESVKTSVFASFVDHFMDNRLKNINPRIIDAETSAKTSNYGFRSEAIYNFGNKKLFAGIDNRTETADGNRNRHFVSGMNEGKTFTDNVWQDALLSKTALFSQYQWSKKKYKFVVSLRAEYNHSEIKDEDPSFNIDNKNSSKNEINTSYSIGLIKNTSKNTKLGIWLGRAKRSGSITEKYINSFPVGLDPYEMVGNPDIKPEINNQVDINFKIKKNNSKLDLSIYSSYMQDYITSEIRPDLKAIMPSSPGVRKYINTSKAYKLGFEFNWSLILYKSLYQKTAMAYTYAKDINKNEALAEIPPLEFRYYLNYSCINNKLKSSINYRHVFKQERISESFGESKSHQFSLVNISLAYNLFTKCEISMIINNIFNENYAEHLSRKIKNTGKKIFAPGRSCIFSINYKF